MLQRILAIARDYFHLPNVAILLIDKEARQLCVRSQIGWDAGKDKICLEYHDGITGASVLKKQPVYSPDVTKDPRYICAALTPRARSWQFRSWCCDEVVGVLDCQSDQIDRFDHDTIELLTLFSTQASIALQNAHLYSLERKRARQLEAINAIAQQSTAVMDLEDLLARVCSVIQQAFQVEHVSLLLREEERSDPAGASRNPDSLHTGPPDASQPRKSPGRVCSLPVAPSSKKIWAAPLTPTACSRSPPRA